MFFFESKLNCSVTNLLCGGQASINNWFPDFKSENETSYTFFPWVKDVRYWFSGQSVKGGIDNWKWCPYHKWLCNPPTIMKSTHFIHPSEGCILLILGSRGRNDIEYLWLKMVSRPLYNLLYISPLVLKLKTLAPHESGMIHVHSKTL